jgi:hypothetical protein
MASPSRTLKLTYLGDASQLKKENAELEQGFGRVGDGVKKFGKVAAVGLAVAATATIAVGKKLFDAAEAAGTANARIENITTSMGNFGERAQEVAGNIANTAGELAKLTGVERNTIKETQALLLTFDSVNKTADQTGGIFDRATKAAVDLAAAGFGSATGNAAQLGKALENPIKGLSALTRSGVTFTDAERERIEVLVESNRVGEAQAIILEAIEKQVGGTAEATSNASDRIKQSFGVIVDQIALALAPTFEKLTDVVAKLIDRFAEWWKDNGPRVIEVITNTVQKAKELWDIIRQNVEPIVHQLIETFRNLIDRFNVFWERVGPAVFDAFTRIKDAVILVFNAFKPLITTVKDIFGALFSGVSSGGGGQLFETFLSIIVTAIEVFANALKFAFDRLNDFFNLMKRVAESKVVQGIAGLVGGATSAVSGLFNRNSSTAAPAAAPRNLAGMSLQDRVSANLNQQRGTNITINGALDAEGTARQVRKILDDSVRRVGAQQSAVFAP